MIMDEMKRVEKDTWVYHGIACSIDTYQEEEYGWTIAFALDDSTLTSGCTYPAKIEAVYALNRRLQEFDLFVRL
jgi:hypothetical protein